MNNLFVSDSPELMEGFSLIKVDAKKCKSLRDFYETLSDKLKFPDYFGFNMDSFDELMNDLSWIVDEQLHLHFENSQEFLINERNEQKVVTLLDMLDATIEDWKYYDADDVEVEEGEEPIPAKELIISFSPSERIEVLIES